MELSIGEEDDNNLMAVVTPTPRIGKYSASIYRPKPADSERQPRNARFHDAAEMAQTRPAKRQKSKGLINRGG